MGCLRHGFLSGKIRWLLEEAACVCDPENKQDVARKSGVAGKKATHGSGGAAVLMGLPASFHPPLLFLPCLLGAGQTRVRASLLLNVAGEVRQQRFQHKLHSNPSWTLGHSALLSLIISCLPHSSQRILQTFFFCLLLLRVT